jgi:hypothetical protein
LLFAPRNPVPFQQRCYVHLHHRCQSTPACLGNGLLTMHSSFSCKYLWMEQPPHVATIPWFLFTSLRDGRPACAALVRKSNPLQLGLSKVSTNCFPWKWRRKTMEQHVQTVQVQSADREGRSIRVMHSKSR